MNIRKVRMLVVERGVRMFMHMRLLAIESGVVWVLMMRIVHMAMRMLHRFVLMGMGVMLGQMQADAQRHQRGGDPEQQREGIA